MFTLIYLWGALIVNKGVVDIMASPDKTTRANTWSELPITLSELPIILPITCILSSSACHDCHN